MLPLNNLPTTIVTTVVCTTVFATLIFYADYTWTAAAPRHPDDRDHDFGDDAGDGHRTNSH
jgi:hypothetical protein